jgi:N-acetylglutamate synthase-like GNAT family acetyltransferase
VTAALRPVVPGTPAFTALRAALAEAGLPVDDLAEGARLYAVEADGACLGHGGLEGSGPDQLLRSVLVPEGRRGRGDGAAVVAALAARARADGAMRLWLLTTTAAPVFVRLGWTVRDRAEAPPAIAASRQFAALCPASASLMCRDLAPG